MERGFVYLLIKALIVSQNKEGWIMFFVVWKRGLERVVDNMGFATRQQAKEYATREVPTGWGFGLLQFSQVKVGV